VCYFTPEKGFEITMAINGKTLHRDLVMAGGLKSKTKGRDGGAKTKILAIWLKKCDCKPFFVAA